jgi:aminoglycoside phosphotransferase family enzyme
LHLKHFVSQYLEMSDDVDLKDLLYFLMCYKACVRAKVSLFRAKNETDNQQRRSCIEESKDLLVLAESYIESTHRGILPRMHDLR